MSLFTKANRKRVNITLLGNVTTFIDRLPNKIYNTVKYGYGDYREQISIIHDNNVITFVEQDTSLSHGIILSLRDNWEAHINSWILTPSPIPIVCIGSHKQLSEVRDAYPNYNIEYVHTSCSSMLSVKRILANQDHYSISDENIEEESKIEEKSKIEQHLESDINTLRSFVSMSTTLMRSKL